MPGLDEMEVFIVGALGMFVADVLIPKVNLGFKEGGFESNEAGPWNLPHGGVCQLTVDYRRGEVDRLVGNDATPGITV